MERMGRCVGALAFVLANLDAQKLQANCMIIQLGSEDTLDSRDAVFYREPACTACGALDLCLHSWSCWLVRSSDCSMLSLLCKAYRLEMGAPHCNRN